MKRFLLLVCLIAAYCVNFFGSDAACAITYRAAILPSLPMDQGVSWANDVSAGFQVGTGRGHAALWNGEAGPVDLHQYLIGLGPVTLSVALGVNDDCAIVGSAFFREPFAPTPRIRAVLWTPVPEPSTLLLIALALAAICKDRRGLQSCRTRVPRNAASIFLLLTGTAMLPLVGLAIPARADIYQWEYIDPLDPSQGKQQSTTLAPDGAGVDAVPGADLSGLDLTMAYLTAANLTNVNGLLANLTNADLTQANLTNTNLNLARLMNADLTGAEILGANFGKLPAFAGTGIALPQLYSTASYLARNLSGISFLNNNLAGANFVDQDLSNASFALAILTGADFSGATLRGAMFRASDCECTAEACACIPVKGTGAISLAQIYSTASYQNHDMSGIGIENINLAGGNFAGQNLANSNFAGADLTGADFTAADARGAFINPSASAVITNLIRPNGHIDGLTLDVGNQLVVRDYEDIRYDPPQLVPITIDQHLAMGPGGTLRMVFEADAWDSTISFAPGIPVTRGGTLELTFAEGVDVASQRGRTFDLFDWTGVDPTGSFTVDSPYVWDLAGLYTTGEVTLTAIPEPSSIALAGIALGVAMHRCRRHRNPLGLRALRCTNVISTLRGKGAHAMKNLLTLLIVLFTGSICFVTPALASEFEYSNFQSTTGLTIFGGAIVTDNVLRLTSSTPGPPGFAWTSALHSVDSGFTTTFDFRISDPISGGADGFAFVVQRTSIFAQGWGGGGIGYHSIPNSLAVEFDTWQNVPSDGFGGDPSDNHVSIHTAGTAPNSADESASLGHTGTELPLVLSDGFVHTVQIDYRPGTMSVYIDDLVNPVLSVAVDLNSQLNLVDGTAILGFTSAVGGSTENHDILSWSFRGVPEPSSAILVLLVVSSLATCDGRRIRCTR